MYAQHFHNRKTLHWRFRWYTNIDSSSISPMTCNIKNILQSFKPNNWNLIWGQKLLEFFKDISPTASKSYNNKPIMAQCKKIDTGSTLVLDTASKSTSFIIYINEGKNTPLISPFTWLATHYSQEWQKINTKMIHSLTSKFNSLYHIHLE